MDKILSKQELMTKIQELGFSAVELNLFLDTHPDDVQALQDYSYILSELQQLKQIYNQNYGPLANFGQAYVRRNYWDWVAEDEKWPWENM
ncbi:MAG TPA: spore coat protein CotJB [Haloplasmataceae bacterium]|jgi:spore coat protein JB